MEDGQLSMGIKAVQLKGNTLIVDDTEYKLTPGLHALITLKQPLSTQWNSNDYQAYKKLVAQAKVRSFPNRTDTARPHATWKWKKLLKTMVIPTERIPEGSEETDDASDTASIGDIESSDIASPASTRKAWDGSSSSGMPPLPPLPSPARTRSRSVPPSPTYTRSYGKKDEAKKTKDREPFYRGYEGRGVVVYLPGDVNGLSKKLHLLASDFFAGNTTVRNELVHVLDALLRLEQ